MEREHVKVLPGYALIGKPKKESERARNKIEDTEYYLLGETKRVVVHDGFITFVKHFKYIGSWIFFSRCDDFDVKFQSASANSDMGALLNFLRDDHVDLHSKYIIFLVTPVNLLPWICESWSLYETLLNSLKKFLVRSIRSIMSITMRQVKENSITDYSIREKFYYMPTVRNQIVVDKITFSGFFYVKTLTSQPRFSPLGIITR